jgi:DNA-binding NarL/FixJ family response regulator
VVRPYLRPNKLLMITTRILIADGHFLSAYGLQQLVQARSGLQVVGIVADEEQLLHRIQRVPVDLIVLDYLQPGNFSTETVDRIRKKSQGPKVLIISEDHKKQRVYEVLESQVDGYITKGCEADEILDAIETTAKGGRFFCNSVLNFLLEKSFGKAEDNCLPTHLSPRETEIVRMVAQGMVAKQIAAELNLSPHTVYTHRKNIMRKLSIKSTSELVLYAVELGIIDSTA